MTDPVLPPTGPANDLTGKSLGGYTILRRLGRGGMADVYLATQESLSRRIALKILRPELACDDNYVRRFHNEAKSVAALVHPHIVQVYEIGAAEGLHFIAQEYVPGRSLKHRLKQAGSLPIEEAVGIIVAAAQAIDKAAGAGVIHRDIKPDNILLTEDGSVKVADFGLARRTDANALELTQTGMTMGTPLYMSPEQIEGKALDCRSDIYSLGVTAYHMLAGRPPFDGDTPVAVAMKHMNVSAEPLDKVRPQVPSSVSKLVAQMMAKSPDERPGSGEEIQTSLQEWLGGSTSVQQLGAATRTRSAAAKQLQEAMATPRPKRLWRRALPVLLGVLLATLVFGRDPLRQVRPSAGLGVPQKESAEQQYFYAMHVNTEEAWRAVMEYFPSEGPESQPVNRAYHLKTKRQLVRWYVDHEEPQQAMKLINELAALDDTDREFQLFGQAMKVLALAHQGKTEEATSILTDIWESRDELDTATRTALERARRQLLNR